VSGDGPAGLAVLILAAGVAIALPASLIIVALEPTRAADSELLAVISTLAAAAIGAVGAWLGGRRAPGGSRGGAETAQSEQTGTRYPPAPARLTGAPGTARPPG
jgi:hypothetical protein